MQWSKPVESHVLSPVAPSALQDNALPGQMGRVVGIVLLLSGCASSLYGWQSRTNSTPVGSSFHADLLKDRAVALFPAVTSPGLRGNEVAIPFYLWDVVRKLAPTWKTITARETVSRINGQGLADDYIKLMLDYEPTSILNRDLLRKIAGALGVRYVFQPRLIFFVQTMTDRWKVPAFDVRIAQTRRALCDCHCHRGTWKTVSWYGSRLPKNKHGERSGSRRTPEDLGTILPEPPWAA